MMQSGFSILMNVWQRFPNRARSVGDCAVDFKIFRPALERAVPRADRGRGGRPAFDHILFKVSSILGSRGYPSACGARKAKGLVCKHDFAPEAKVWAKNTRTGHLEP